MIETLLLDELRFLTFRDVSPAIRSHWKAYLAFGLVFTWLAGVGRYWDNPRAEPWQLFGLGSVAYVFVLAAVVWLLLAPLRPKSWSYRNVLLFITLTAPPAVLYAIPVERFLSESVAQATNAWFLAVVAAWRVALLVVFLRRVAGLSAGTVVLATMLPLALIVLSLAMLNLEHVVFALMSGNPEETEAMRSPNDTAYVIVSLLALLSYLMSPILLVWYIVLVVRAWRDRRAAEPSDR